MTLLAVPFKSYFLLCRVEIRWLKVGDYDVKEVIVVLGQTNGSVEGYTRTDPTRGYKRRRWNGEYKSSFCVGGTEDYVRKNLRNYISFQYSSES